MANQPALVEYLLRQGMDVTVANNKGQTAIHLAVDKHVSCCQDQKSILAIMTEFASGQAWDNFPNMLKNIKELMIKIRLLK